MIQAGNDRSIDGATGTVTLPAEVCWRMLVTSRRMNEQGLKGFGVLVADPDDPRMPYTATDVIFFDPTRNRRNDVEYRAAFRAQGEYFRSFDDAGFVADAHDLLSVWRSVERQGLEIVAPFHVHRRQPANFSVIDYRLHNPAFAWHLILSLSGPGRPVMQPFQVIKSEHELGINADDGRHGSERDYLGPEVRPLDLQVSGSADMVDRLTRSLSTARWNTRTIQRAS